MERIAQLQGEVNQLRSRLAQDATLATREALLSEAERTAHLGSWMWDLPSQKVFWSDEMFRVLGKDPAVDEASSEEFLAAVHPDDLTRLQRETELSLREGVPRRVDFRVKRGDDVREIVMDGAFIRNSAGAIVRMVGSCLDVTERRRTERDATRWRSLLEVAEQVSGVGVFYFEDGQESPYWSPEMFRIFGTHAPLQAGAFHDVVVAEDLAAVEQMQRAVRTRGQGGPIAYRVRRPDGSIRHLLMSARSLSDPFAITGSIVDITTRIELEGQLRQAQKMEALGRLAGGVAHDFNNLLVAIIGNAEALLAVDPASEAAGDTLLAAQQAAELTKRLLAFSRDAMIQRVPLDLNTVVEECLPLLRRVLGADVVLQFTPEAVAWTVHADASQLNQILLNLAINARDALPSGGKIDISVRNVQRETPSLDGSTKHLDLVVLCVRDDGVGMSDEVRARIFEPFFTTKHPGEGTGFGLATVFNIVRRHEGFIEVDSQPGRGTEFRIYFPRCADSVAPPSEGASAHGIGAVAGAKVLVVEDEPLVRRVVRRFLQDAGYTVLVADCAEDAFRQLAPDIDLLLTDLVLPDLHGTEVARRIRERLPDVPVLYMTGHAANTGGHTDHPTLQKPFTRGQLLAAVNIACSKRRAAVTG